MLTAAKEVARLTDAFAYSGKAKRIFEPTRALFVSEEEHRLALTMRVKLCVTIGERVMVCKNEEIMGIGVVFFSGGQPGLEPGTSCTQSKNHAARPLSQLSVSKFKCMD